MASLSKRFIFQRSISTNQECHGTTTQSGSKLWRIKQSSKEVQSRSTPEFGFVSNKNLNPQAAKMEV